MLSPRVIFLATWFAGSLYVAFHIDRGWVPHDDGLLAQTAARVLLGELPHRDFDATYTGGLSYLHALAFMVLGSRLLSLRLVLLAVIVAGLPLLYYVASRLTSPAAAGAIVLLGVVWSVPAYPAAVPSWYHLFLTIAGLAALMRFTETEGRQWLFLAGLAGGVSFLVKLTGLYLLAAGVLVLLFLEQRATAADGGRRDPAYRALLFLGLGTFVLLLFILVGGRWGLREVVHFIVPGTAVAFFLLWREERLSQGPAPSRVRRLARWLLPYLAGAALPVVLFLVPYLTTGALGAWLTGVFVQPASRLQFAGLRPPALLPAVVATVPLGWLLVSVRRGVRWARAERLLLLGVLASALVAAASQVAVYDLVWHSVRTLAPMTVVGGLVVLATHERRGAVLDRRGACLFIALAGLALAGLNQFPFSAPIYFCYIAPLVAVAATGILEIIDVRAAFPARAVWAFYLAFGALWVDRAALTHLGQHYRPDRVTTRLALPRGGIRVPAADATQYTDLVRIVDRHAPGPFIYATPDCPEVYFLTGRQNPTRTLFEFLSDSLPAPQLERLLDARAVPLVVVNREPEFSPGIDSTLQHLLAHRFPDSTVVGKFVVRWRS